MAKNAILFSVISFYIFIRVGLAQLNITINNRSIAVNIIGLTRLMSGISSVNQCGKMRIRSNFLYHLSKDEVVKSWNATSFVPVASYLNYSADSLNTITDFDVNQAEKTEILLNSLNQIQEIMMFSLNSEQPTYQASLPRLVQAIPSNIFLDDQTFFKYYRNSEPGLDWIVKESLTQTSPSASYTFNHSNSSFIFSPDFRLAISWTANTEIYIYNASNFQLLSIFNHSFSSVKDVTGSIGFNDDSTFALVESDQHSDILIINLTDFSITHRYSYNSTVIAASFLTQDFVIVIGAAGVAIWNLEVDRQTLLTSYSINCSSFVMDFKNRHFFVCYQNTIMKYEIKTTTLLIDNVTISNISNSSNDNITQQSNTSISPASIDNNQSTINNTQINDQNTTNQTASNSSQVNNYSYLTNQSIPSDYQNTYTPAADNQFTIELNFSSLGKDIYEQIKQILQYVSPSILQKLVIIATSTPFTFYFLNFLNYINMCTLYVFLNITIPDKVYERISQVYLSINKDLFQIIEVDLSIQPLSDEKIQNPLYIALGLSSDLILSNYLMFGIIFINLCLSAALNQVGLRLNSKNRFRKYLLQKKCQMVSGQIISSLISLTLPWYFVIYGGSLNFNTKLNMSLQYIFLFVVFGYPLFFLYRLFENQQKEEKLRCKFAHSKNKLIHATKTALYWEILQDWNVCFNNFLYPFLVVISQPLYFLIAIYFSSIFSLILAFKKKKWKGNSILLACYPICFHTCFFIFYLSSENKLLQIFGILCLLLLLIGSVHHILTLLATLIHTIIMYQYRKHKLNEILPVASESAKTQAKRTEDLIILQSNKNIQKVTNAVPQNDFDVLNVTRCVDELQLKKPEDFIKIEKKIKKDFKNRLKRTLQVTFMDSILQNTS